MREKARCVRKSEKSVRKNEMCEKKVRNVRKRSMSKCEHEKKV